MVGIDVVDMNSSAYQHRGYLKRITSCAERSWVLRSARPDTALWQLWAAKEATYKALSPTDGTTPFRPSQIAVHWRSHGPANSGEARWGVDRTHVTASANGLCAYAIATRVGRPPRVIEHAIVSISEILPVAPNCEAAPEEQSAAARRLTTYLLRLIGIGPSKIERAETGRPFVTGRPDISVSWSHDGRWIAAIVALQGGNQ